MRSWTGLEPSLSSEWVIREKPNPKARVRKPNAIPVSITRSGNTRSIRWSNACRVLPFAEPLQIFETRRERSIWVLYQNGSAKPNGVTFDGGKKAKNDERHWWVIENQNQLMQILSFPQWQPRTYRSIPQPCARESFPPASQIESGFW